MKMDLVAGVETDERIAIAVGWAGKLSTCPRYSGSLEAAWMLVDRMQQEGWRLAINTTCDAHQYDIMVGSASEDLAAFTFETLTLGICKAFLFTRNRK